MELLAFVTAILSEGLQMTVEDMYHQLGVSQCTLHIMDEGDTDFLCV